MDVHVYIHLSWGRVVALVIRIPNLKLGVLVHMFPLRISCVALAYLNFRFTLYFAFPICVFSFDCFHEQRLTYMH